MGDSNLGAEGLGFNNGNPGRDEKVRASPLAPVAGEVDSRIVELGELPVPRFPVGALPSEYPRGLDPVRFLLGQFGERRPGARDPKAGGDPVFPRPDPLEGGIDRLDIKREELPQHLAAFAQDGRAVHSPAVGVCGVDQGFHVARVAFGNRGAERREMESHLPFRPPMPDEAKHDGGKSEKGEADEDAERGQAEQRHGGEPSRYSSHCQSALVTGDAPLVRLQWLRLWACSRALGCYTDSV